MNFQINIFTIPTGWAAINLAQMQLDNSLQEDISMFSTKILQYLQITKDIKLFIVIEMELIWLNFI